MAFFLAGIAGLAEERFMLASAFCGGVVGVCGGHVECVVCGSWFWRGGLDGEGEERGGGKGDEGRWAWMMLIKKEPFWALYDGRGCGIMQYAIIDI